MRKRPNRHFLYSLLMAGTMTGCVSATVTAVNLGFGGNYLYEWLHSWSVAFPVGFFLLLLLAPFFKSLTDWLVDTRLSRKSQAIPYRTR